MPLHGLHVPQLCRMDEGALRGISNTWMPKLLPNFPVLDEATNQSRLMPFSACENVETCAACLNLVV